MSKLVEEVKIRRDAQIEKFYENWPINYLSDSDPEAHAETAIILRNIMEIADHASSRSFPIFRVCFLSNWTNEFISPVVTVLLDSHFRVGFANMNEYYPRPPTYFLRDNKWSMTGDISEVKRTLTISIF